MSVTAARLGQVDQAESALRALGIRGNLRVRHHGELARVEMDRELLSHWSAGAALDALVAAVRAAGFARVEVDPRGFRSGALNVLANVGEPANPGATLSGD
jgi:uncharacterized protein